MDILKQLKEVTISVLPIAFFSSILSMATGVMDASEFGKFMLSCLLVILGLTLFLTGVEVGITPIGSRIGSAMTKSRSLLVILLAAVVLGIIITIPEPDVQVLASQVNQVTEGKIFGNLGFIKKFVTNKTFSPIVKQGAKMVASQQVGKVTGKVRQAKNKVGGFVSKNIINRSFDPSAQSAGDFIKNSINFD